MMHPTKHERGSAVIIARGARRLPGIVALSTVVGVGQPGVHRYRYTIKPAGIRDGRLEPIPGLVSRMEYKHEQLSPFDPTTHTEKNTHRWRY